MLLDTRFFADAGYAPYADALRVYAADAAADVYIRRRADAI